MLKYRIKYRTKTDPKDWWYVAAENPGFVSGGWNKNHATIFDSHDNDDLNNFMEQVEEAIVEQMGDPNIREMVAEMIHEDNATEPWKEWDEA